MKLLLCSDLHAEPEKIRGIIAAAINNSIDLVCVSGDLIDFTASKVGPQCCYVTAMILDAHTGLKWAVCSGNHDYFLGEETSCFPIVPRWIANVGEIPDGHSKRFARNGEEIVVTTIPWPLNDHAAWHNLTHRILTLGKRLATEADCQWLVMAHEPPNDSLIGRGYKSWRAELTSRIISTYEPDFVHSGHIHESPALENGTWISKEQDSPSICFNAGQSDRRAEPWYVILELFPNGSWKADHNNF